MAPLKHMQSLQHRLSRDGLDAYPWLRGHGSIEATITAINVSATALTRIHGWEAMAPLKRQHGDQRARRRYAYPWLGGHGSIEGP